jgi:hypothetical protein
MSFVSPTGLGSQVNFKISLAHPNAIGYVPSLQREDGSYIGTDSLGNVDALGLDGSMDWQQYLPGATPLYATDDGGAIVTTTTQCPAAPVGSPTCTPTLGTLYTFDQYGTLTSQTADTGAKLSWTNEWYLDPPQSISRFFNWPVNFAPAWAAILNGNRSGTSASAQETWFPWLDSCYDPESASYNHCPGPFEVAYSAVKAVRALVQQPCENCETWVFEPLPGGGANVQLNFSQWLNEAPGLYDGTKSNAPQGWLCRHSGGWGGLLCNLQTGRLAPTVADYFNDNPSVTNISEWPSPHFFQSYYNPSHLTGYCFAQYSSSTTNARQKSITFHEALHGFFGLSDAALQTAYNKLDTYVQVDSANSSNITDYIAHHVFGSATWQGITDYCGPN